MSGSDHLTLKRRAALMVGLIVGLVTTSIVAIVEVGRALL